MRFKKKKGERGEERFWALGKRERTKGRRRFWKDTIGVNALPATKEPGLVSTAYFGWWSRGWGRGYRLVEQTLHLQVTSSQEMTQRALEGEPGMKALCPSSISGLSHQSGCVPFWKGEAKGILSTVPGGLAGWAPLRVGELPAARPRASVRQEPSSLHLSAWGRVEEGGEWASPSWPRGDRLTAGRVMCPCL